MNLSAVEATTQLSANSRGEVVLKHVPGGCLEVTNLEASGTLGSLTPQLRFGRSEASESGGERSWALQGSRLNTCLPALWNDTPSPRHPMPEALHPKLS